MLRTNLSTRPFYNERSVQLLLAMTAMLVAAFTIFNITQLVLLTRQQSALGGEAQSAETRARELRAHAAETRQAIDAKKVEATSGEARVANEIIGQRLFSWTDLLNRLETTLPDDVRITSLRPRVGRENEITVQMTVTGRSVEEVEKFMANLEQTTAFSDVIPLEDSPAADGSGVQVSLEGKYAPAP
jgi:Tfp pilus assembly protein PilN